MPSSAHKSPRKASPAPEVAGQSRRLSGLQAAQRLHDTVCQTITGSRFLISAIQRDVPPDAANLVGELEKLDSWLAEASHDLRKLISELRNSP